MKVVIAVKGGCVTSVCSDVEDLEVLLFDFDNYDEEAIDDTEDAWEEATHGIFDLNF